MRGLPVGLEAVSIGVLSGGVDSGEELCVGSRVASRGKVSIADPGFDPGIEIGSAISDIVCL